MHSEPFSLRATVGALAATAILLLSDAASARAAGAVGEIKLPPGFRAELVYDVPLESQGSWVSLTVDDRGRLIASDQGGALYRLEPAPLGADAAQTKVQPLRVNVGFAQGLLFHQGQLYVMLNGQIGGFTSGLYRLSDTNKDDQFDRIEQLRVFNGEGEHGPHAIVLAPDGKSLYICCGNFTGLPAFTRTMPAAVWGEDQLLPRIFDPRGHANDLRAPGGWVARLDLDGNNLDIVSVGYRNIYDIAFNADGELFTYDSDMEWDIGTPWYRPTRICHVTSGSEWGWRSGNGPFPVYFPDTVPPAVETGPGSPTGIVFGAGSKFPERYQRALFAGDWSYGNIYAIHLSPAGSSYRGEAERFASAMPLGVTDMVVRPQDGALYFTVGGRQSESAVYRIVYTGEGVPATGPKPDANAIVSSAPAPGPAVAALDPAEARALRHSLEKLHAGPQPGAVDQLWPHLGHADRFIANAARVALEHQPLGEWSKRALNETDVDKKSAALVAFARLAKSSQQGEWVDSVARYNFAALSREQRLNLLRAVGLAVMRLEPIAPATRKKLLDSFDAHYPTGSYDVDRELANLLVRLRATGLIERLLKVMENAGSQEEGIDAAMALSAISDGWTADTRTRLLDWFDNSAKRAGGLSFFGYLASARDRFIAAFPAADRQAFAERINKPLTEMEPQIDAQARPVIREWKLDEVVELVEKDHGARSFDNGRKMFSAAGCYACHRVAGEGSSIGPDLTGVGGRFGVRDLLRAVVEPSHTISDQYQQMVFETNGRLIVGRVSNISAESIMISTNMLDPKKTESIPRSELDDQYPSDVSMMPSGLLNTLSAAEILDLTAFLRAGGKRDHELFVAGGGE
jgi:hypothetical protein